MENENIKKGRGRPKLLGASAVDAKKYAMEKMKEVIKCNVCNCEMLYYSLSAHNKSEKHKLKLQIQNLQQ
jgi:hypothetical protein